MRLLALRADDKGDGAGGGTAATSTTTAAGGAGTDAGKTDTKAAAGGDTTLTKASGDAKTGEGTKGVESKDTKVDTKAAALDYAKWEPKAVDGVKRDDKLVGKFREAGKKFGLSSEQMQGVVDFNDALVSEFRAERERTQQGWIEAVKADKELGGSKWSETSADLDRVMKKYGDDPELRQLLNETGYGDHPALVRFVARIGKSMREDSINGGSKGASGAKKPTLLEQLYGNPKS